MVVAAPLRCPVCAVALSATTRLLRCTQCQGAWVSEETIAHLVSEHRAQTQVAALLFETLSPVTRQRPCPHCQRAMRLCGLEGITLDRCPAHGIWIDTAEQTRARDLASADPSSARPRTAATLLTLLASQFPSRP